MLSLEKLCFLYRGNKNLVYHNTLIEHQLAYLLLIYREFNSKLVLNVLVLKEDKLSCKEHLVRGIVLTLVFKVSYIYIYKRKGGASYLEEWI